jgi:hypothetical protein
MKLVTIEAMFPELKGGSIYHTARAKAGSSKAAIAAAFRNLIDMNKGKRYQVIKCTVTVVTVPDEPEETAKGGRK